MEKMKIRAYLYRLFLPALMFTLLLAGIHAYADDSHITFTNVQTTQPDLYITKSVKCAVDGYDIPDAEFTFVLKWDLDKDGKLTYAKNEVYYVYAADGTLVKNYDDNGNEISWKTNAAGRFTLKAGQTAKFEYVGTDVEYEITEVSLGDNWTQTTPADGLAATGTVDEDGTIVYFENTYVPEVPDLPPEEEDPTTTLSVKKVTVDVNGNTITSDEAFTFTVTVGGSAWAEKTYTIYDSDDNEAGTGTTDSTGTFTITGGQCALFGEIPLYEDYSVTESEVDGWECMTDTTQEGGTSYPVTYTSFTNQQKGGKIKLIKVDSSDNSIVLSGAVFKIYDSEYNLVETITTGTDGSATSSKLPVGTYYISEKTAPSGYLNETVQYTVTIDGNSDIVYPDDAQNGLVPNTKIRAKIKLTKVSSEDHTEKLSGAVFSIYSDESCADEFLVGTMTSGTDGVAVSEYLEQGTYYVKETEAPLGYLASDCVFKVLVDSDAAEYGLIYLYDNGTFFATRSLSGLNASAGIIYLCNDGSGLYENEPSTGKLTLTKVSSESHSTVLADAVFGIYSDNSCKDEFLVDTMTSGVDGVATSGDLSVGTYYVKETEAPFGYELSDTVYTVTVEAGNESKTVTTDGYVENTPLTGSIKIVKKDGSGNLVSGVTFMIEDEKGNTKSLTTDSVGEVTFEDLAAGDYTITETKTVSGLTLLASPIEVTIPLAMTRAEVIAQGNVNTADAILHDGVYYFYNLTYEVDNNSVLSVPTSGGTGYVYGLFGILLVLVAAFIVHGSKRKEAKS